MNERSLAKTSLRRDGFTFKQFFVAHDRCAMKVGTDSVLLGAWAPLHGHGPILDIGCGSGVLALMLAQRSAGERRIDAVEVDSVAAQQAAENAAASPWNTRIHVFTEDIQRLATQERERYALIVSNPPYYPTGIACRDRARATARYTAALTHRALLDCAARLLRSDGVFCVVLPLDIGTEFTRLAAAVGWYPLRQTAVAERETRPAHRMLMAFSRRSAEPVRDSLIIRQADGGYSAAFTQLTREFYLTMP